MDDAKKLIERNGLVVGTIEYVESELNKKDIVISQDPAANVVGAQAGKGTAVNLKVGSGEKTNKFALKIPLPKDFAYQYGTLSYWVNNGSTKEGESSELDFYSGSDYTFNIATKDAQIDILIKISAKGSNTYENYVSFKIDCKTGSILETKTHSYSKK